MRCGGGLFFTVAATGGDRSPSETMQRYAFPRVRRACAYDVGRRKFLIWGGFIHALASMKENKAFRGLARAGLGALSFGFCLFLCTVPLRAPSSKLMEIECFFGC